MTMGLLLYVTLVIVLAAGAGWAVETLCRQLGRPARWAWLAASALAVVLVARATMATGTEQALATYSRIAMPAASTVAVPAWSPLQTVRDVIALSAATVSSAAGAVVRAVPRTVTVFASLVWLATSLLALAVLAFVHLRIRRARRHWAETELFGTRVRIAPAVGPAVVGVIRPQIVVPRWLLGRTVDEQQLVLDHEREHLSARDHLLLGAGSIVVALVPWHPAAWWMLARLRLAIELDCDARVLRKGVSVRTYGTLLIDLADRCTGFRVGATALADEGSHLERRLLAMKTTGTRRSLLRAGVLGTAAALALLAACEAKVPTGPEIQSMDVASAERAATRTRMFESMHGDSVVFYVDGKRVDAAAAHALAPNQIAAVEVSKSAGSSRHGVIRIRTNGQAPAADAKGESGLVRMHASMHSDTAALVGVPHTSDSGAKKFEGLLLIDGIKADQSALHALDPKKIESIEVIKGAAALKLSDDPAATNGIIKVTTKK